MFSRCYTSERCYCNVINLQQVLGSQGDGRWLSRAFFQSRQKSYLPAWHNPHTPITHRCCGGSAGTQTKESPTQSFFSLLCSCLRVMPHGKPVSVHSRCMGFSPQNLLLLLVKWLSVVGGRQGYLEEDLNHQAQAPCLCHNLLKYPALCCLKRGQKQWDTRILDRQT